MDFKALKWLFLFTAVIVLTHCAADERRAENPEASTDLEPAPSHDDSHGWGANVGQVSGSSR